MIVVSVQAVTVIMKQTVIKIVLEIVLVMLLLITVMNVQVEIQD